MHAARDPRGRHPRPGGWSLVELMIALALGLAVTTAVLQSALRWSQELRASHAHLLLHRTVAHTGRLFRQEGRGAGHWADADSALIPGTAASAGFNPYAGLWIGSDGRTLTYGLDGGEGNGWFGIRQHPSNRTLDLRLSGTGLSPSDADQWQATTDALQIRLDTFTLADRTLIGSLLSACDTATCPTGAPDCAPHWARSGIEALGTFRMTRDAALGRNWRVSATARNLHRQGQCPT